MATEAANWRICRSCKWRYNHRHRMTHSEDYCSQTCENRRPGTASEREREEHAKEMRRIAAAGLRERRGKPRGGTRRA